MGSVAIFCAYGISSWNVHVSNNFISAIFSPFCLQVLDTFLLSTRKKDKVFVFLYLVLNLFLYFIADYAKINLLLSCRIKIHCTKLLVHKWIQLYPSIRLRNCQQQFYSKRQMSWYSLFSVYVTCMNSYFVSHPFSEFSINSCSIPILK